MSVRSAYRRRRRLTPPADLTPFALELEGRPRLLWASFLATCALCGLAGAFLYLTP